MTDWKKFAVDYYGDLTTGTEIGGLDARWTQHALTLDLLGSLEG